MSHHAGLLHEQTCGRVAGQGTEKSQRQEGQDGDQDDERPQAQALALAQAAAHGRARNTERRRQDRVLRHKRGKNGKAEIKMMSARVTSTVAGGGPRTSAKDQAVISEMSARKMQGKSCLRRDGSRHEKQTRQMEARHNGCEAELRGASIPLEC